MIYEYVWNVYWYENVWFECDYGCIYECIVWIYYDICLCNMLLYDLVIELRIVDCRYECVFWDMLWVCYRICLWFVIEYVMFYVWMC